MNTLKSKRCSLSFLIPAIALFCFGYAESPLYAQAVLSPPKNLKGFVQVDLSANMTARTVVEDTSPGVHFEGEAVSTRLLTRVAAKPWSPVEFYLQAGVANLAIEEFDNFKGDYRFAYGGGINLEVYEYPGPERFRFLIQGDTLQFTTSDNVWVSIATVDVLREEKIRWQEYAIQGTGIWRVDRWEPYLGARFSWVDSTDTIKDPQVGKLSLQEDSNLGLVAGTSLYIDPRENFAFHFEVTLIDQASFLAGVRLWY